MCTLIAIALPVSAPASNVKLKLVKCLIFHREILVALSKSTFGSEYTVQIEWAIVGHFTLGLNRKKDTWNDNQTEQIKKAYAKEL